MGWMVSGKYASEFYITGQKGSKAVPPEEWIITKGTHEPIVTEELFNRVQEYFAKNKGRARPLLRSMITKVSVRVCSGGICSVVNAEKLCTSAGK